MILISKWFQNYQNRPQIRNASLGKTFDFNTIGKDFIKDPFPTCKALREYSPIDRILDGSLFLTRYSDVLRVCRDPLMSSDKKIDFKQLLYLKSFIIKNVENGMIATIIASALEGQTQQMRPKKKQD